jgi:CheY-like chemotaxis protein
MQDQFTIRSRVLIADDHSVVAEGLRSLLEKKYEVVGIVPDGRELLVQAPKLKPDAIVLDIGMPLLNGLDAAERLNSSLPKAKFVFHCEQSQSLRSRARVTSHARAPSRDRRRGELSVGPRMTAALRTHKANTIMLVRTSLDSESEPQA